MQYKTEIHIDVMRTSSKNDNCSVLELCNGLLRKPPEKWVVCHGPCVKVVSTTKDVTNRFQAGFKFVLVGFFLYSVESAFICSTY